MLDNVLTFRISLLVAGWTCDSNVLLSPTFLASPDRSRIAVYGPTAYRCLALSSTVVVCLNAFHDPISSGTILSTGRMRMLRNVSTIDHVRFLEDGLR
jgi:hypothetical protein